MEITIKDRAHLKSLTYYASNLLENQDIGSNNQEDAAEALNFFKQITAEQFNTSITVSLPNCSNDFVSFAIEDFNDLGHLD